LEDVVHHRLERGQRVGEAEAHHQRLKEPSAGTECGLPLIASPDMDVVEAPSDLEFREELSSFQAVNMKVLDGQKPLSLFTDIILCEILQDFARFSKKSKISQDLARSLKILEEHRT
jgi:hypothetical protein